MCFLIMKLWESVPSAFRLFLVSFHYFVKTYIFFHPLNRNDDLKASGVEVGVGVGSQSRSRTHRNPRSQSRHPRKTRSRSRSRTLYLPTPQPWLKFHQNRSYISDFSGGQKPPIRRAYSNRKKLKLWESALLSG